MLICNTPLLSLWQSKLPESNPSWLLGTNVTVKCNQEDVSCLSAIRANNLSGLSLSTAPDHYSYQRSALTIWYSSIHHWHCQALTNSLSDLTFTLQHRWHILPSISTIPHSNFGFTNATDAYSWQHLHLWSPTTLFLGTINSIVTSGLRNSEERAW